MSLKEDMEALERYLARSEGAADIYAFGKDVCKARMTPEEYASALADYNEVRNSSRPYPPSNGVHDFE